MKSSKNSVCHIYVLYDVSYHFYCYFFHGFILGVVVSPSVYSHLPSIFRDPISLLLVFWCCNGFTLPRKCLFWNFLGPWGRQTYAPGPAIVIQSWVSFKFLFSEYVWVCYFLSVIHTLGLPGPRQNLSPGLCYLMLTLSFAELGGDEFSAFLRLVWGCPNECNGPSVSFVKRNVNYFQQSNYVANERLTVITSL